MKKVILCVLALCFCSVFLLTGCTKKDDTGTTATVKTPIQQLNESVWAYRVNTDNALASQQASINDLVTRLGTLEVWKSGLVIPDFSDLNTRVNNSISSASNNSADIAFLKIRVQDIQDLNISARLDAIETKLKATPTPTVNVTPTPTANVTPTPTMTPMPTGSLTKPVAIYPSVGNTSIVNGSILFQWSSCNATIYEFWFGNNSTNMALIDTLDSDVNVFLWPVTDSNTYYFWRIRAIVGTSVQSSTFWFKTQ